MLITAHLLVQRKPKPKVGTQWYEHVNPLRMEADHEQLVPQFMGKGFNICSIQDVAPPPLITSKLSKNFEFEKQQYLAPANGYVEEKPWVLPAPEEIDFDVIKKSKIVKGQLKAWLSGVTARSDSDFSYTEETASLAASPRLSHPGTARVQRESSLTSWFKREGTKNGSLSNRVGSK